jgi:hypothetical protein
MFVGGTAGDFYFRIDVGVKVLAAFSEKKQFFVKLD